MEPLNESPVATVSIGVPLPVDLVGRDGIVADIHESLVAGASEVALVPGTSDQSVALHGMGGVGKSALAIRYCYAYKAEYGLIWWVNAESSTTVSNSYQEYLNKTPDLKARIPHGEDPRPYVDTHLSQQLGALVVYDNLADESAMREVRPSSFEGAVLITTRNPEGWSTRIRVETLAMEPARDWLLHAAKKTPTRGADIGDVDVQAIADAEWLAGEEATNGLALALKMATGYLANTGCGLAVYRELYKASNHSVLDSGRHAPADYQKTVYLAFAISLHSLIADNRNEAVQLIEMASFYAPDDIPTRIFTPESLNSKSPDAVYQALGILSTLGLVDITEGMFSVHRVVQEVVRFYLKNDLPNIDIALAKASKKRCTVVLATAQATDAEVDLDPGRTMSATEQLLKNSPLSEQIDVIPLSQATTLVLSRALVDNSPTVVTIIAHGTAAGIELRHEDGGTRTASPTVLADMFQHHPSVQVVVLGACYSAKTAQAISAAGVAVVVGTLGESQVNGTRDYITEFHHGLAKGRTCSQAHSEAVIVVGLNEGTNVFELNGAGGDLTIFR